MSPRKQTSQPIEDTIPGKFGPHPPSMIMEDDLIGVHFLCGEQSPEDPMEGYCCAYEVMFSNCGLYLPLPELLVNAMYVLGVSLPQLCPNFIRTILCLQTLAEEHVYLLTFQDVLHLYTIKGGRTKGTFYLSPLAGFRVLDDLPEKDDNWRSGYFYFPVDSFTFGELADLFIPKWSLKIANLERGSLSCTFADCFLSFCGGQTAWDSFPSHRIQESGARNPTSSLVTSSPQPVRPRNMNYREERAYKKQAEIRERELKKQMAAALAEGKSKTLAKEESPCSTAPPEPRGHLLVAALDSTSASGDAISEPPTHASTQEGKEASEASKKRKAPDSTPVSQETSCPRTSDSAKRPETSSAAKRAEASSKGTTPLPPAAGQKGEPRRELPDMMRSFSRPGARVPFFQDMVKVNWENYFHFAEKVRETLIEFNSAVASYEHQLLSNPDARDVKKLRSPISELEKRVKRLTAAEAANHLEVERAKKSNSRLKLVESEQ
ncbi:meiosis-specific protein ASY2-like [Capsella rubella]|uniref:meiosis-specific protein ASY2-like n=1 Tax=Capsella rubella TaxID=81985 RepID=UPI000CD4E8A4|nr:meiosis-specific protein ASY2-like [Capsella rubella]